jgi:hypothetical protein
MSLHTTSGRPEDTGPALEQHLGDEAPGRVTEVLSAGYGIAFERLLADVAWATPGDVPLVAFWALRGATYDGELLVIGRSVNGWVDDWTAAQLRDPAQRTAAVAWLRRAGAARPQA